MKYNGRLENNMKELKIRPSAKLLIPFYIVAIGLSILLELGVSETLQGWFRRVSALDFQYGKRYVEDNESSVTLKNSETHVLDWWEDLLPRNPPEQQRRRVEEYWST